MLVKLKPPQLDNYIESFSYTLNGELGGDRVSDGKSEITLDHGNSSHLADV